MASLTSVGLIDAPGHVIKTTFKNLESTADIVVDSSSYMDTGLEIAHVTARSSADSVLIYDWWVGMDWAQTASEIMLQTITMRTVSNATYTSGEQITYNSYPTYRKFSNQANNYDTQFIRVYCGLESGMGMPATKSSWAAGDTLYFRMFAKSSNGNTTRVTHANTSYNISITEIERA